MKTIIIPTDFSENARHAIGYAVNLFGKEDAKFILLHAYKMPSAAATTLISLDDIMEKDSINRLEEEYEKICNEFYCAILNIERKAEKGDLVDVLKKMMILHQPDYIVMGTKGATGLAEVLLGSVASSVISSSLLPVIIVPDGASFKGLENIAFAGDNKEIEKLDTVSPLIHLATAHQSTVKGIYIQSIEDTDKDAKPNEKVPKELQSIIGTWEIIASEKVEEGINLYLDNYPTDMVVTVSRKHGFFYRLFQRSVTRKMALHSEIPMMVLPEK
jgi:nucleotide-binding universal stress UspA family protein